MINIPNFISFLRLILCPILYVYMDNKLSFYTLYSLLCLSDILDGYIARKKRISSNFGARLDSLADFLFFIIIFIIFYKKHFQVLIFFSPFIFIIALVRILNLIYSYLKFNKLISLHTIMNKITGILLIFILPFLDYFNSSKYLILVITISLFSSIEESLILYFSKHIDLNVKSIFSVTT